MKRVITFILIFVATMIFMVKDTAYAAESKDYLTWIQHDPRWENYCPNPSVPRETVGRVGCDHTCVSILCAMADPSLRDSTKFNPGKPTVDGKEITVYWGGLGKDAPIKDGGIVKTYEKSTPISTINQDIANYSKEGKYIILRCVQATYSSYFSSLSDYHDVMQDSTGKNYYPMHYVTVIGINSDGYPIVWDVARGGNTYPDRQDGSGKPHASGEQNHLLGYIQGIWLYEPKEGFMSADEAMAGISADYIASESARVALEGGLVSEGDLIGMPPMSMLKDGQVDLYIPNNEGLSATEKNTIGLIKDNMDAGKTTFSQILHTVFTVIGLVLMIYAVLLWLSFIFDRVNVFFDFSLVYFLSFGRLRVIAHPEDGDTVPQGYITNRVFFIKTAVIFAIGALLVSGVIIHFVERITSSVGG